MVKKTKKFFLVFCVLLVFSTFVFIPFYAKSQEPDSRFGINAFVSNRYQWNEWDAPINSLKELGVSWTREEFMWEIIEPEKGNYNFGFYDASLARLATTNINILGIIDYSSHWASTCKECQYPDKYVPDMMEWRKYVSMVVGRYGKQVKYWQIWNEPNIDTFLKSNPKAENYLNLLKNAYEVIKEKSPESKVVLGGTSGVDLAFLRDLKDLGAEKYVDIIAVHPYRFDFKSPPEGTFMDDLKKSETISREYGGKPIWFTEFGWPTDKAEGVNEEMQAKYLVRTYVMSFSSPDVKKLFWYDLRNDGVDSYYREHNFGIINRDYSKKKSFLAYKNLISLLEHSVFNRINKSGEHGVYDFSFLKGGNEVRVIWKTNGRDVINLGSLGNGVRAYDYLGNKIDLDGNKSKSIEISDFPTFIVLGEGGESSGKTLTYGQTYEYQFIEQSPYLEIKNGEQREAWLKIKNTGTATWSKEGSNPVILGTCRNTDRGSGFFVDRLWIGSNRAAKMQEEYVAPGEIATFKFGFKNNNIGEGVYREYFCPVIEGLFWMKDIGIFWDLSTGDFNQESREGAILKKHSFEIVEQSPFLSVNKGEAFQLKLKLKNTGDADWIKGSFNLGTSRKKDRHSFFRQNLESANRVFLDQDVVKSGEVGVFTINMKAPESSGVYKEYFRPLVEGSDWLGDRGIYWFIKVN